MISFLRKLFRTKKWSRWQAGLLSKNSDDIAEKRIKSLQLYIRLFVRRKISE